MTRIAFICIATLVASLSFAQTPVVLDPPEGAFPGFTETADGGRFMLCVPNKTHVYLIGDFNDWSVNEDYLMNVSTNGACHWIDIPGLEDGVPYRYQFLVEGAIAVADPYAELILDPWNDQYINANTYPGFPSYPFGETDHPVSVAQKGQSPFPWSDQGYQRPPQDDLMIYEIAIRDWDVDQNYQSVIERLDYLQTLGITAVQLMPIHEFDGNLSWGYNTNFWFAPDKHYGSKKKLQELINACHERGMAVILDIVINHSFGLNPQVRMFWDQDFGGYGSVSADNPWFNQIATHPFSIGYDYNHESSWTRDFFKDVFSHWIQEYHVDGFRLDLSKGLTQNQTNDIGAWNSYDQSRVNILFDYGNHCWNQQPGTYMILEHLGDNPEESALANGGFMLWGVMNEQYAQATMGWGADLSWADWQNRGWNWPNLIAYAESHDEDRIAFKTQTFGNDFNGYDVKQFDNAMERQLLMQGFVSLLPGPKMMYQWAEYGYDYSIELCPDGSLNSNCRTDEKPERWDYLDDPVRRTLFKKVAAVNRLKRDYSSFSTDNYITNLDGQGKRILLYHPEMDVVVSGNFDVIGIDMVPGFSHTGTWYDYFSGNSFEVTDLNASFYFAPGQFNVYTDQPLPTPDTDGTTPILPNPGCTDEAAVNFDPNAESDDASCRYNVTLRVNMEGQNVGASGVHVAGSFQGWNPSASQMIDEGNHVFSYTFEAQNDELLTYKFINGDDWSEAEVVPNCGVGDGFGGYNRAFLVSPECTEAELVCFESCALCLVQNVPGCNNANAVNYDPSATEDDGSCQFQLSFFVEMANEEVSTDGVHIAGNFQGWDPSGSMLDLVYDQVYRYQAIFSEGDTVLYKFINGNEWGQDESVPNECGLADPDGNVNRQFVMPGTAFSLPVICYETCLPCEDIPGPGCTYPLANNYNPNSIEDDGSCIFTGCTDSAAVNYSTNANQDDGSCVYGDVFCGENSYWSEELGQCVGFGEGNGCTGDLNSDGLVNATDLLSFLSNFGGDCQ